MQEGVSSNPSTGLLVLCLIALNSYDSEPAKNGSIFYRGKLMRVPGSVT